MKICFIADSQSIHVRRIVAYFIRKRHEVLVLSTAERNADLPDATTVYALPLATASAGEARYPSLRHRQSALRRYLARKCKSEHKLLIRRLTRTAKLFLHSKSSSLKIREFSPHIVIAIRAFPEGVYAYWCGVQNFIVRTAGSDITYYPQFPILGFIIRKVLQKASCVITQSLYEEGYLKKVMGLSNFIKIANIGTDIALFSPADKSKRPQYGLREDSVIIVSNRSLEGFYNGLDVIEAFMHAKQRCAHLELLYINPFSIHERVRRKIKFMCGDGDGIHLVEGPIPQAAMAELVGCGDIWASFSSIDGVPSSLLEAMSCGLIPIVGDIPQLHEWVLDGYNGFVVPPRDVTAMADRMVELAENKELLDKFSIRCRKKICQEGSYERNMEQMLDSIIEAVDRQKEINRKTELRGLL